MKKSLAEMFGVGLDIGLLRGDDAGNPIPSNSDIDDQVSQRNTADLRPAHLRERRMRGRSRRRPR